MAKMMYCPNCRQNVNAKKFNWIVLILLLILFVPAFIVAGAYYTFRKPKCPICDAPLTQDAKPDYVLKQENYDWNNNTVRGQNSYGYGGFQQQSQYGSNQTGYEHRGINNEYGRFCGNCGTRLPGYATFCSKCGKKV